MVLTFWVDCNLSRGDIFYVPTIDTTFSVCTVIGTGHDGSTFLPYSDTIVTVPILKILPLLPLILSFTNTGHGKSRKDLEQLSRKWMFEV